MAQELDSPSSMRLFVAVVPEPAALSGLIAALEVARTQPDAQKLRWLPSDTLHLTLRFLGSVPTLAIPQLRESCATVAASTAAFDLTLAGAGAFPSARRATVVWIGAAQGADQLTALAENINTVLEPLGHAREPRRFTPHLTVARSKRPSDQSSLLQGLSDLRIQTRVQELVLMRSHLSGQGARYEGLERYALRAAQTR